MVILIVAFACLISKSYIMQQDTFPIYEEFVMVNTTILVEHPNYATVTYEELQRDVIIGNPHGLEVKVMQKDMYSVKLDSTTFVNVKPDIIQYKATDRNSFMTSFTEVKLNILKEEKEPVPEEKENNAPKGESESVKAKTNNVPVEEKNSEEEEENADVKTEQCILSCTTDSKGNVTLILCNGEIENHQATRLSKKTSFDLPQVNNSLAEGRYIILRRDLSGFEMINDKEKSDQFEMCKAMDDVCMDKDPVIGSVNLCSYTTIAPVYDTASQEWLMSSAELIKNVKKKDLIPSTYGPPKSWIHPFNLNDQKLQKLQENFGTGDGEKQKTPLAVTLRIIQEIFSAGINIANELKEGLSRYKSKAQDMRASYLAYEYAPDEEEEEIMEIMNRIADSPENVIRKYRIAMLEKTMLKQAAEHDYHKQTRHPSICMRKLIDEALQADYHRDLIRNYPKHVPPYFDSVPGMCFRLALQTADEAMEKVEETSEENLPQKLSTQSIESSSDECECIAAMMDKAYKKLIPKSTPTKEPWKTVLGPIDEEARGGPTLEDIQREAADGQF